jgi:metal-dependent HD superfamily phosphatase/phosphodiesterase
LINYEEIKKNEEINIYIKRGNELLGVLGYTEHSQAHSAKVSVIASDILKKLGFGQREIELAKIAGYMHDIGNVVNRIDHAQTGAIMAFNILTRLNMDPDEVATIVAAIGNHDEGTGTAVNPVSAALIMADKTDVRRSRVRNSDFAKFDIHDRVNYAVTNSQLNIDADTKTIELNIELDTNICSVMDYFEIFLGRMLMCRRAAEFLNVKFKLVANGAKVM